MQRARGQLLAGPRLAGDEHRAARVGDLRQQRQRRQQRRIVAQQPRARAGRARRARRSPARSAAAASARRRPPPPACATSNGLIRKSRAPACIARTASGISALPLIAMTGVPGACMRAAARISNPLTPGMRMSVRIRSKRSCLQARVAAGSVHRDNFMTRGAQDAPQAPAEGLFVVAEEDLSHGVGRARSLLESCSSFSRPGRFAASFFWHVAVRLRTESS